MQKTIVFYTGVQYPFYMSIIYAIRNASSASEMKLLAMLIKATKIRKGHYRIIAEWKRRLQEIHWQPDDDGLGVKTYLRSKGRRIAAKKKANEAVGFI